MSVLSEISQVVSDEMLKALKQRRKGFLSNLTKTINRAEMLITTESDINEIAVLKENVEFALFKLQKNLEDICLRALGSEVLKAQQLFNENNERANKTINKCERIISQLDDDKQSEITTYAFEQLFQSRLSKGSKYSGSSSKHSSDSSTSEKEKILAVQKENRAKRNLELLKMKQKLEEAEATEQIIRAKEQRELAEASSISQSELASIMKSRPEQLNVLDNNKVRQSSSYFVPRNIPVIETYDHENAPQSSQNIKYENRPPTPYRRSYDTKLEPDSNQSIDAFIDALVEGTETVIASKFTQTSSTMALLEQDLESRNLPPMELLRFNGNPSYWPEFIQCFKERVHMKRTFSDSLRMERLLSVLDGDAKRVVSAIGRNGLFYATALKALKREFGNPYAVSYLKLKAVLEQGQIKADDQKGLRQFHQQLKTVVTWLTSMGYLSSLNSTENVTKAVMRLKLLKPKWSTENPRIE